MTTPIRPPRHRGAAAIAVAALAGLLIVAWHTPERGTARRVTALSSATSSTADPAWLRIELVAGDRIATATLDDTPEAHAFAAMLPVTVRMEDRFGQAKTGLLPRVVPLGNAGRSPKYADGDLAYWSPSGRIAVIYDALGRSVPPPGLVRLGRVQTGVRAIAAAGNAFTMTIRRVR